MIFPSHCRFVGVVSKHLRPDYRPDDAVYFSSQYVLIFEAPDRCAVYEVASGGEGFIRRSQGVKMIADVDQTVLYDGQVDITNRADLIRKASALCKGKINTVVFQGIDRHYTFVYEPSPEALRVIEVYDVAPPWPAWLEFNVRRLDEAGMFGDLMLTFDYHTLDLKDFEDPARTTIFPCHASGLNGLFLDSLDEEPRGDIKLVGCNTSKLVFDARFPLKRYEHVNICPLSTRKPQHPFILRCCQSDKLGPKVIGGVPGVVVHWGASPRDVCDAVRQLASTISEK
ncbi:MAG: hypothetical protein A4E28_01592 [Methanocella sp. PtaU1.Bin125]|nr:MAG: hypothetical protein A4E28_01592 [Methanocella sp. PtaU1.Bin125]